MEVTITLEPKAARQIIKAINEQNKEYGENETLVSILSQLMNKDTGFFIETLIEG